MSSSADQSVQLFTDRTRVYPKAVKGYFRRLKWLSLWLLLGVYYLAPWLRWDRGEGAPGQALLIDMPARKAYFFFIEIWAQEVYYLTGVLIIAAIALFFATAVAGRVWCGFACPQTVWTDLFMWVERKIEGDRAARMRRDQSPLTLSGLGKKLVKHFAWLLIALATGGAWVFYFNDAPTLLVELLMGRGSFTVYSFIFGFTASTYLMAGWAREQVCTYMCPYARFQGAMIDDDSLIVSYDAGRGEPRGAYRKGEAWDGRGHCVSCRQCVVVCPTGIDIRDGQQLECIGCGLCADACDGVMEKLDLAGGLVRFDTLSNLMAQARGETTHYRFFRPRTIVYSLILVIVGMAMLAALMLRSETSVSVLRDRNPLYVKLSDGSIRNGFTFKVLNMKRQQKSYDLSLAGIEGARMTVIGRAKKPVGHVDLHVRPDSVGTYRVFVHAPAGALKSPSQDLRFVLVDRLMDITTTHQTTFRGPAR
jgi:cytochrome c oxidase accessory protein FixG